MTEEEWMQACSQADPLDNYLQKKKEFEATEPREKSLKLLRADRQQYLLNRSEVGIQRLRYITRPTDDLGRNEAPLKTFELSDLPPTSFVGIGPSPSEAQRRREIWIDRVEWRDEVTIRDIGQLKQWSPHTTGGTSVSGLDLRYVPRVPTLIAGE